MTDNPLDTRQHATAVKTAVSTALGEWSAYDWGKVPGLDGNEGPIPDIYALVSVERRAGLPLRQAASTGRTGWRVDVRAVGRTTDEARWALMVIAAALNEQRLMIAGLESTRFQTDGEIAPALDDGRYSGLSPWTYAL